MVEEIIDLTMASVVAPPSPNASRAAVKLIERRGDTVPLLPLAQLFALNDNDTASKALLIRRSG